MTIEQKAWLGTFILIFIGYILLKVPIVDFIVEAVILLICATSIYSSLFELYKEETKKTKNGVK